VKKFKKHFSGSLICFNSKFVQNETKRSSLFNLAGFIESFSESKLSECQDPIVLTSTVNGYCLVDEHCRNLEGTVCSTAGDQVKIFKRLY
jgi:hypothetical protein